MVVLPRFVLCYVSRDRTQQGIHTIENKGSQFSHGMMNAVLVAQGKSAHSVEENVDGGKGRTELQT